MLAKHISIYVITKGIFSSKNRSIFIGKFTNKFSKIKKAEKYMIFYRFNTLLE